MDQAIGEAEGEGVGCAAVADGQGIAAGTTEVLDGAEHAGGDGVEGGHGHSLARGGECERAGVSQLIVYVNPYSRRFEMNSAKANRRRMGVSCAFLMWTMCAGSAMAHPSPRTDAPIERVVANLEARIKADPNDSDALYSLGRAHALAYANKSKIIRGYGRDEGFEPLAPDSQDWNPDPVKPDPKDAPTREELVVHLQQGANNLVKAIQMKREPRYYLALASLLETASDDAIVINVVTMLSLRPDRGVEIGGLGAPRVPERDYYVLHLPEKRAGEVVRARIFGDGLDVAGWSLNRNGTLVDVWDFRDDADEGRKMEARAILGEFWKELMCESYFRAFALSLADEAKSDRRPMGSGGLRLCLEAAEGFKRVFVASKDPENHDARLPIVETSIKELGKQHQSGGITPIIFSLEKGSTLNELVNPDAVVKFNLDGTGLKQSWSWVKPETGILVWDPERTGKITSGRQLFGSVTWWVMFEDGYQALDALDDNRDGWLTGKELEGIAVWFDRNSNAVSDADEVVPIESLPIHAVAVRPDGVQDGCSTASGGVVRTDGRSLATFDWVATRR